MATFIAMLYRTVSHIIYLKNNILHRKIIKAIKKFSIFTIATIIIIILSNMMCTFNEITVRGWIIYAVKNTIIGIIVFLIVSFIFYKRQLKQLFNIKNKHI